MSQLGGFPRDPSAESVRLRRFMQKLAGGPVDANKFFGGPSSGTIAKPAVFRALALADLPLITVPGGGTGLSSLSPWDVLLGGTTSTGPVQQVSGEGASGQILTSNGAGAKPTWQSVPGAACRLLYANTTVPAGDTIANTMAQTAFASQYTLPANSLAVQTVLRIQCRGLMSSLNAGANITFTFKMGTTVMIATVALGLATQTSNSEWNLRTDFIVDTIGAVGTLECQGEGFIFGSANTSNFQITNSSTITLDTTSAQVMALFVQWGAASPSNTITLRQLIIELLQT